MGVAVQKGAGQGILRGDGALGQIGGGQSGQQLHNGKAAARFGDRHAQQGRHLAERVWYGTGNGKGNTVPGFQCGAGGRRLQNNGIGLQGLPCTYSTVTRLARFLGVSTSRPLATDT